MKVQHTLICFFFFLSLQEVLLIGQIIVYTGTEGANITVTCTFSFHGSKMLFCKEECKAGDVLIETSFDRHQRGRYSMAYEKDGTRGLVSATVTHLTKSDYGLYRCGLHGLYQYTYKYIEIIVIDALLDGNTFKEKTLRTRTGGSIVVQCIFPHDTNRKYFCKDECGEDDILVKTTGDKKHKGRYSIEYVPGPHPTGSVYVSITQLTESDSGRYRCAVDKSFSVDPYREFTVVVKDDPITPKPDLTVPDLSFPVPSASTPTTTQSFMSDQQQTTPTTGGWLYVGLTLAVMVVLLSLAVVIYCRKRSAKTKDLPVETEYGPASQDNQVYENIRAGRQSRSPPVEISSAKCDKMHEAETDVDSGTVTSSPNTAQHDSSGLTYSELSFSRRPVGSSSRLVGGQDDNVVYSVPRR